LAKYRETEDDRGDEYRGENRMESAGVEGQETRCLDGVSVEGKEPHTAPPFNRPTTGRGVVRTVPKIRESSGITHTEPQTFERITTFWAKQAICAADFLAAGQAVSAGATGCGASAGVLHHPAAA